MRSENRATSKNHTNRTPKIKAKIHKNGLKRDPKPKTGRNREKTEAHYTTTKQVRTERKQRLIKLKTLSPRPGFRTRPSG